MVSRFMLPFKFFMACVVWERQQENGVEIIRLDEELPTRSAARRLEVGYASGRERLVLGGLRSASVADVLGVEIAEPSDHLDRVPEKGVVGLGARLGLVRFQVISPQQSAGRMCQEFVGFLQLLWPTPVRCRRRFSNWQSLLTALHGFVLSSICCRQK